MMNLEDKFILQIVSLFSFEAAVIPSRFQNDEGQSIYIYETKNLLFVHMRCEAWSLTLREEKI
jgi:hypothetical protein